MHSFIISCTPAMDDRDERVYPRGSSAILLTGFAGHGKSTCADYLVSVHGAKKYAFADKLKHLCVQFLHDVYGITVYEDEMYSARAKEELQYYAGYNMLFMLCYISALVNFTVITDSDYFVSALVHLTAMTYSDYWRAGLLSLALSAFFYFLSVPRIAGHHLTIRRVLQYMGTEFGRAAYSNVWVDGTLETIREDGERHAGDEPVTVVIEDMRFPNEGDAHVEELLVRMGFDTVRRVRILRDDVHVDTAGLHESERHIPALRVEHEILNSFAEGKGMLYSKLDACVLQD